MWGGLGLEGYGERWDWEGCVLGGTGGGRTGLRGMRGALICAGRGRAMLWEVYREARV